LSETLRGQRLEDVRRRAKYLLMDFTNHTLVSHFGMSGSWRLESTPTEPRKHDHIVIELSPVGKIIFNDPRRFGLLEIYDRGGEEKSPWLKHLGVEPLSSSFTATLMSKLAQDRKTIIKTFLMDQKNVVGVGNIYASEALYLAGINP